MTEDEAKEQLDNRMRALQDKHEMRLDVLAGKFVIDLVDHGKVQPNTKQEAKQLLMQLVDEVCE